MRSLVLVPMLALVSRGGGMAPADPTELVLGATTSVVVFNLCMARLGGY